MDINTNNNQSFQNQTPNQMGGYNMPNNEMKNPKKTGPVVIILVIVLALIIAIIYFVGTRYSSNNVENTTTTQIQDNSSLTATATQADDVDSLNNELDSQLKDVEYSF